MNLPSSFIYLFICVCILFYFISFFCLVGNFINLHRMSMNERTSRAWLMVLPLHLHNPVAGCCSYNHLVFWSVSGLLFLMLLCKTVIKSLVTSRIPSQSNQYLLINSASLSLSVVFLPGYSLYTVTVFVVVWLF